MAKMRPEDIAKWITEDVKPGETGVVAEALFGHVIKPSEKPIDLFIAAVDTNYCGTRLSQFSPDGEYSVQFPEPQECRSNEPVSAPP